MSVFLTGRTTALLVLALLAAVVWVQPAEVAPPGPEGSCDGRCRYRGTYVWCNHAGCQGTPYRDLRIDKCRCCNSCDGCWFEYVRYCTRAVERLREQGVG